MREFCLPSSTERLAKKTNDKVGRSTSPRTNEQRAVEYAAHAIRSASWRHSDGLRARTAALHSAPRCTGASGRRSFLLLPLSLFLVHRSRSPPGCRGAGARGAPRAFVPQADDADDDVHGIVTTVSGHRPTDSRALLFSQHSLFGLLIPCGYHLSRLPPLACIRGGWGSLSRARRQICAWFVNALLEVLWRYA